MTNKRLSSERRHLAGARAFTLIELVLVLALATVLLALTAGGLAGGPRTALLDEGAAALETTVRMARAEAAIRGRRLRLRVGESTPLVIEWEADPLGEPQVYEPLTDAPWARQPLPATVRLIELRLLPMLAYPAEVRWNSRSGETAGTEGGLKPVALEVAPDGSCNSVEFELVSSDEADRRVAIVAVDGLSGQISRRIQTLAERSETFPSGAAGEVP